MSFGHDFDRIRKFISCFGKFIIRGLTFSLGHFSIQIHTKCFHCSYIQAVLKHVERVPSHVVTGVFVFLFEFAVVFIFFVLFFCESNIQQNRKFFGFRNSNAKCLWDFCTRDRIQWRIICNIVFSLFFFLLSNGFADIIFFVLIQNAAFYMSFIVLIWMNQFAGHLILHKQIWKLYENCPQTGQLLHLLKFVIHHTEIWESEKSIQL